MPHNLSRERNLPAPLKIRTDWFNPSIAHQHNRSSKPIFENLPRLVPKKCPSGVVNSDTREIAVTIDKLPIWTVLRAERPIE